MAKVNQLRSVNESLPREIVSALEGPATREDAIAGYRLFLRRDPESEDAIAAHLADCPTLESLIMRFAESDEHIDLMKRQLGRDFFYHPCKNRIETDVTPEQNAVLEARVRETWTRLGKHEPHWSVLVAPQFRQALLNEKSERIFYASGKVDVEAFLSACAAAGVRLRKQGVVLDFGCGVGRLGEHLSARFAGYLGVDISESHLQLARAHFAKLGRANSSFQTLPEFLAGGQQVDAVMSLIVLQHNPPPMMVMLIDTLLKRLKRGGVAFLQVPCYLHGYQFHVEKYLAECKPEGGDIEMHALPQERVFRLLYANRCRPVRVVPDDWIGDAGHSFTFLAVKV